MTTAVQRRRGTTTEHASFTGLEGEISVNTTKETLVVHDGSTVGGFELARADGSNFVATSVDINGGTIDGTTIGASSASTGAFTTLTASGEITANGGIALGDNDKATFGAGDDLQIYHDGSGSYVSDTGTGPLRLQGSGVRIVGTGGENLLIANETAEVTLLYNNSPKLATTSTGIDVTGTIASSGNLEITSSVPKIILTDSNNPSGQMEMRGANTEFVFDFDPANAENNSQIDFKTDGSRRLLIKSTGIDVTGTATMDGLTVSGSTTSAFSSGSENVVATFTSTDTEAQINLVDTTGSAQIRSRNDFRFYVNGGTPLRAMDIASNGDVLFYEDTGTTPKLFWDASAESLGIGAAPTNVLHVKATADTDGATIIGLSPTATNNIQGGLGCLAGGELQVIGTNQTTFWTAATQRMVIDSDGNVGIGCSPTSPLHIKSATNVNVRFDDSGSSSYTWYMNDAQNLYIPNVQLASTHTFYANGQRKVDIDSSGNLLVGTTVSAGKVTINSPTNDGLNIAVGNNRLVMISKRDNDGDHIRFLNSAGTTAGNINVTGTTTTYTSVSDERLKENITDADDAGSKIDAIQVRQYDWKADGSHQDYGMIAQELVEVAPEAVSVPEDSEEMMGVDYSKLVPMLIKEIQSLRNRVAQLEG